MPANVIITGVQIGQSGTPTNNFTIRTLDDGSLRISRGNAGAETSDVLVIDANGNFSIAPVLGVGQTWQNVTASRALGTNYTNTTGKAIAVSVATSQGAGYTEIIVNGVIAARAAAATGAEPVDTFAIVPPGAVYSVTNPNPLVYWAELR